MEESPWELSSGLFLPDTAVLQSGWGALVQKQPGEVMPGKCQDARLGTLVPNLAGSATVSPGASDCPSLGLSFLIYEMEIRMATTLYRVVKGLHEIICSEYVT